MSFHLRVRRAAAAVAVAEEIGRLGALFGALVSRLLTSARG